jgi:hypothetical protein
MVFISQEAVIGFRARSDKVAKGKISTLAGIQTPVICPGSQSLY